jgi:protein-tyrosine-phosphatase
VRVLIVCHANTARSVMAHLLLERMLRARGADGRVTVRSAGVGRWARDGMLASHDARIVLRDEGIHLGEDDFVSTALPAHPELLAEADLVITMTVEQRRVVEGLAAGRSLPIVTLRELAGEQGDIGDPAGQGDDVFRACRDEIKRCLAKAVEHIA